MASEDPIINQSWLNQLRRQTARVTEEEVFDFCGNKKAFLETMKKQGAHRTAVIFANGFIGNIIQDVTTEVRMQSIVNIYRLCSKLGTSDDEMAFKEEVFRLLRSTILGHSRAPQWARDALTLIGPEFGYNVGLRDEVILARPELDQLDHSTTLTRSGLDQPTINESWLVELRQATALISGEIVFDFAGGRKAFFNWIAEDPVSASATFVAQVALFLKNSGFDDLRRMESIILIYQVCAKLGTSQAEMDFKEGVFDRLKKKVIEGSDALQWVKDALTLIGPEFGYNVSFRNEQVHNRPQLGQ